MIRQMQAEDTAAIARLESLCFSEPWSEKSISSELTNELSYWLVYLENNRVVGYLGTQSCPPESDVMNIAVDPEYRRRGIARSLLCTMSSDLVHKGMASLTLEVRASNTPAIDLYTELGFAEIGRRKKYYVNPIEDALILRKDLSNADIID